MTDETSSAARTEYAYLARDRVLLLMILSSAFLFLSFAMNWEMNRGSFEVMDRSDILHGLGTVEASLIALAVAAVIVALPEAKRSLWFEYTALHLVATVVGVLVLLLVVTWDLKVFVNVLVQTFVLVFFSAPLIFGLFGVLHHRPVHLVISAMFSFFIAGGVRNTAFELPYLLLFGLFFLLFIELAESTVRCWNLLDEKRLSEQHLASFVDHYLRNLAIFMTVSVVLTMLVLNLHYVIGALGLSALADSVELRTVYGQVMSCVVVLGSLGLLRFLHDRGYTAPWMARLKALRARLTGRAPEAGAYVPPAEPNGRYPTK